MQKLIQNQFHCKFIRLGDDYAKVWLKYQKYEHKFGSEEEHLEIAFQDKSRAFP